MARRAGKSNTGLWIVLACIAGSGLILAGVAVVGYLDREAGPRYEVVIGPELKKTGATFGPWTRQDGDWGCIVKLPATAPKTLWIGGLTASASNADGVKIAGSSVSGPRLSPGESGLMVLLVTDRRASKVTVEAD